MTAALIKRGKLPFREFRWFLAAAYQDQRHSNFDKHRSIFERAYTLVRCYYVLNLFIAYSVALGVRRVGLSNVEPDYQWPVLWMNHVGLHSASLILVSALIVSSIIGLLFSQHRWARILVSLVILEHAAWANSFGAINHGYHMGFWISFCLIFLPDGKASDLLASRVRRMQFLTIFSMTQALILLFYSLAGAYKVAAAVISLTRGHFSAFAPEAMANTLAFRMLQSNSDALLAPFIIENHWIGWPLYLGLYYVQFVAILIAFRPQLHVAWGVFLIGFHVGTLIFMEISFSHHVLYLALLFVLSPFVIVPFNWRIAARQLPIFGLLLCPVVGRTLAMSELR